MQNKAKLYAEVLKSALEGKTEKESEKIAENFKKLLKRRGDVKLMQKILREFERLWEERKGKIAQIFSARPLSHKSKSELEEKLKKEGFQAKTVETKELIGGIAVMLGSEAVIDNTILGKLRRIQKRIQEI